MAHSKYRVNNTFLIMVTCVIALILQILPLPVWAAWGRPDWVLLIVLYWVMVLPDRMDVCFAFCMGLLLDVLLGTTLGEHALAMTIAAYWVMRMHLQLQVIDPLKQAAHLFFGVCFYQATLFLVEECLGRHAFPWFYYGFPALTSLLLWPWVFAILYDTQQHFCLSE